MNREAVRGKKCPAERDARPGQRSTYSRRGLRLHCSPHSRPGLCASARNCGVGATARSLLPTGFHGGSLSWRARSPDGSQPSAHLCGGEARVAGAETCNCCASARQSRPSSIMDTMLCKCPPARFRRWTVFGCKAWCKVIILSFREGMGRLARRGVKRRGGATLRRWPRTPWGSVMRIAYRGRMVDLQ